MICTELGGRLVQFHGDGKPRARDGWRLQCRRHLQGRRLDVRRRALGAGGLHRDRRRRRVPRPFEARRTLALGAPGQQAPGLGRERIHLADGDIVQRLDLAFDGLLIAGQALRHVEQL